MTYFNLFELITGAVITTITSPLTDVDLTNLVIHPDGSILLASNEETFTDEDGQSQTRVNHYQIDLSDFSISLMPADDIDIEFRPAKIAMISGKAVVVTEALEYANLALTVQFWDRDNAFVSPFIKDVPANNNVIAYNGNTATWTTSRRYSVRYVARSHIFVERMTILNIFFFSIFPLQRLYQILVLVVVANQKYELDVALELLSVTGYAGAGAHASERQ